MIEPVSVTALILGIVSTVGIIVKAIADAIGNSQCMSTTEVSRTGSTVRTRMFSGHSDK